MTGLNLAGNYLSEAPVQEPRRPLSSRFRILVLSVAIFAAQSTHLSAQSVSIQEGMTIEQVEVVLANPSPDAALNQRIIDLAKRTIQVFPSSTFNRSEIEFALARLRRQSSVSDAILDVRQTTRGGISLEIKVSLSEGTQRADRGYLLTGTASDLPVLFDRDGTVVVSKLEALTMLYGNSNAWYGRPDLFLSGNPLASERSAGSGTSGWAEGFMHAGLYGLTPLSDNVYMYGGLSGIVSGSKGTEIFTNETRLHFGIEDAYAGLVGGTNLDGGGRAVWNISAGRKRYSIGDGPIIANTASNGDERAALQSNPRWAADMLVLGQFRYNNTLAEIFYLDPDELPVVDSRTKMAGFNIQSDLAAGFSVGAAYIGVLESDYSYYAMTNPTPASAHLSREGLRVYDARLRWNQPNGNWFANAEFAVQRNENFDMSANAVTAEIGYQFSDLAWEPVVSYRYARFSGDDPSTSRFERWDPLFSGGNGEQWVQGINHFKLFQDSNLITHRLQLRLRVSQQVELVPQLWLFAADSTNNLGGNSALSFLGGKALGYEGNITAKWFISPKVMLQGHIAATFPGEASRSAAGGNLEPWVSAMTFLRVAF